MTAHPVKCRIGGNGPPYILADAQGQTYVVEHYAAGRGPSGVHRVYRCALSGTPDALVVSRVDLTATFVDWSGKRSGNIRVDGPRDPEFLVVYRLDLEPVEEIPSALGLRQRLWELLGDRDGQIPPDAVDELVEWCTKLRAVRTGAAPAVEAPEPKAWTGVDPQRLQDAFEEALLEASGPSSADAAVAEGYHAPPVELDAIGRAVMQARIGDDRTPFGIVTAVGDDGRIQVDIGDPRRAGMTMDEAHRAFARMAIDNAHEGDPDRQPDEGSGG